MQTPLEKLTDEHGEYEMLGNSQLVFEDGTVVSGWGSPMPVVMRPPEAGEELLRSQLKFLSSRLEREEQAFERFKADTLTQLEWAKSNPSMCAPPRPDAEQQLERGADRIRDLRVQVAKLMAQLPKTERDQQAAERDQRRRTELSRSRASIMSITAD